MPEWTDVGEEDLVEEDDVIAVPVNGSRLAIYKIEGEVYVTDDRCTHQEASLADGYLEGTTIECPRHQGVFNICTGKAMGPPLQENLRTYETKVVDGRIFVQMDHA